MLLDTSGLLAALFPDQRRHADCARALREAEPPLLLSPFVLAELDYLVAKLAGVEPELALLDEVANRAYELSPFAASDISAARRVVAQYRDLSVGLADASIVVLAQRDRVADVLTLDERHFRVLRAYDDRPFRVLPADA